jgi:uncharacterized membrane protein YiaA
LLEWLDRLKVWAFLGVIGVILLIVGDLTARIIGSLMVAALVAWVIVLARRIVVRRRVADSAR